MSNIRTIMENTWPDKKTFVRLQDLLRTISIDSHKEQIILSIEKKNHTREYCQLTLTELELLYILIPKNNRPFYECICENHIIKAYIDFEYLLENNSTVDHNKAIISFLKILYFHLNMAHNTNIISNIDMSSILNEFLILDASTMQKKSFHFIHANPCVLFQNTNTLGIYIKSILRTVLICITKHKCSSLILQNKVISTSIKDIIALLSPHVENIRKTCSNCFILNGTVSIADIANLIVNNKNNESVLSIDLNVYSKNQQFRLYDSNKQQQNNPLITTSEFPFEQTKSHCYFQILRKSLVTNVSNTDLPLITFEKEQLCVKQNSSQISSKVLNIDTIFEKYNHQISKRFKYDSMEKPLCENINNTSSSVTQIVSGGLFENKMLDKYIAFINKMITRDSNHVGKIHSYVQGTRNTNKIFFNITGNYRFCPKIHRHHKRNTVAFIVDASNNTFAIRCKDVECDNSLLEWHLIDKQ